MKTVKYIQAKIYLPLVLVVMTIVSCERDLSDEIVLATFPTTAEIFTDAPVGLTDEFFISFDPAGGANTRGFGTDENEFFEGTTSIRIDVPSPTDPDGNFIGGIFRDRGEGRDLSGYDALTFWAKGTLTGSIEVGFGTDFLTDTYPVSTVIQLTSGWKKYIIPIPNASRLVQERGMFLFSAGSYDVLANDDPSDASSFADNTGYTFWMDELKFENLGTNASVSSEILNGADQTLESFVGTSSELTGFSQTVNLASGENITLKIAAPYFDFSSTEQAVANVSQTGTVNVVGLSGTTRITASLSGDSASGSLTVTSNGELPHAPIPTRDAANVVSLFSDAYTNVPVRHYNGFFMFATTLGGGGTDPNNVDIQDPFPDGTLDNIISYSELNFVSIGTYETVSLVDISQMTHLHINLNIREAVEPGDFIRLSLESGTGTGSTTSGNLILNSSDLNVTNADGWVTVDVPLSSFPGFTGTDLGQLFFVSDATISNVWVDNVYFYRN